MLYSAPLVWRDDNGKVQPIELLDFETEREEISESLKEAGRSIEVRAEAATVDHFTTLVLLGCRALHYSGHGHPDFLAFEDGSGKVHRLDADMLRELFAAGGPSGAQLAFVSACHSRSAGEAFIEAGVPHVVCVRLEEPVYDMAARKFAKNFYLALAAGKTVQQAFDSGRAFVKATPNLLESTEEAEKFLLLPEYGKHDVAIFGNALPGEFVDITPPQPPSNLPSRPQHFIGRSKIMQEVVSDVLGGRLVTIRGAPGIGKTALAIEAGHYINERRLFRDGTFFVELRGAASKDAIRFAVATALGIEAKDDAELFAALHELRCLLVLDNCEDPLHHASGDFRKFITQLLQQAGRVKLLLTSRHTLGGGIPGVKEKVCPLHQLDRLSAARLFIRLAPRELEPSEIDGLMKHPILDILSGHPHAISLAVPLLLDKTLSQLYEMLKSQPIETLEIPDVPKDELDAARSFAVSLEVSVGYLRERNPEAVRLFAVMGLLPSGAMPQDLDAIWGEGWRPQMDALVRASLVEREKREELGEIEHFYTFPFVTAYAEKLLTKDDRAKFAISICEHLGSVGGELYRALGAESAAFAKAIFVLHEENLWACLNQDRPATRPKREDEELSPVAEVATYLPNVLLQVDRTEDGIQAAKIGCDACRAVGDVRGEANTLQALGDLNMRRDDLDGALKDYQNALEIYQKIDEKMGEANTLRALGDLNMRRADLDGALEDYQNALEIYQNIDEKMGEANTLQSLGNLRAAEGNADATSFEHSIFLQFITIILAMLGIGADLGYMGRISSLADRSDRAVLLFDIALSIHRIIDDRWGQALDLKFQAEAFMEIKAPMGAIAAWWQAREILHVIHSPSAKELDAKFERLEEQMDAEEYQAMIADLEANAEEWRTEAIKVAWETAKDDPLIQEIAEDLKDLGIDVGVD